MGSINSFVETTNDLVKQVNIALESMQKMNSSMTTNDDTVVITVEGKDTITGEPSTYNYSIPSYQNTLSQMNRLTNNVDTFINGNGVVLLNDGTYRQVTTIPVAKSPDRITGVSAPTTFRTKTNWFFESFMFPSLYIRFDLKNKIDDRSDRIVVKRIIFDNFDDSETQWFKDTFIGQNYLYSDVLNILSNNGKNYWEDEETKNLPILPRQYTGNFTIKNKGTIDNKQWFYLDTINYGLVSDTSTIKNIELKIGDQLRYNNSLFKIDQIETTEKRVHLIAQIGLGSPTINSTFDIYSTPFETKYTDIEVGYNECQIIFLKGVNDDFNIIADDWSDGVSFYTNDLTLQNSTMTFESYYLNYVSDFGKQMEGQAKEKFIPAYFGITPNAPSISADQFSVTQINTHINSILDINSVKNTQTQIETTKTIINSLKTTIAQQKAELVELTDPGDRSNLQNKIDNNISQLSKKTVEYSSLVRSLSTLAYENDAVLSDPKYRIRGFFSIPDGVRATDNVNERPQEIIQFDIAYRYLRLDNTGNPLNTYTHTDTSTGQTITGTFTDWVIMQSPIKKRYFDSSAGIYIWLEENIADGTTVNINQVDIPISKGEKVQIKIRSISEAGWPTNSLKSEWSEPVIVEFPANLTGSDQVVNILTDAQTEETTIKLNETLDAAGINTHIQDSIPNPNSASGTYFKHQAEFIAVDLQVKGITNNIDSEATIDLQTVVSDISNKYYVTLTRPTGSSSTYPTLTATLQQLIQVIIDTDPSIYDNLEDLLT